MLYAPFYGYSVAECLWEVRDGLFQFADLRVRHARRFRYHDSGGLRLVTPSNWNGEELPDRKFWVVTSGASDDDELYGRGLAEWLYWPTLFKRNGLRFWNNFLDKFGSPTAIGKYPSGTPEDQIRALLSALQAIATDTGIAVPDRMVIELLQAAKSGVADYEQLCRYMDECIAKVVLSQTMTTQDGSSLSQAQVHAGVKLEVVKSDADLLSDSFNAAPARWWTDFNYGPDVASPRVMRDVEEETDTNLAAETDNQLKLLGWERTDESFQDVYGDGYVRVETDAAKDAADQTVGAGNIIDDEAEPGDQQSSVDLAEGDHNYVEQSVENTLIEELVAAEDDRVTAAMTGSIFDRISAAATAADLLKLLDTDALALMNDTPLRESIERAAFAMRLAEENREGGS